MLPHLPASAQLCFIISICLVVPWNSGICVGKEMEKQKKGLCSSTGSRCGWSSNHLCYKEIVWGLPSLKTRLSRSQCTQTHSQGRAGQCETRLLKAIWVGLSFCPWVVNKESNLHLLLTFHSCFRSSLSTSAAATSRGVLGSKTSARKAAAPNVNSSYSLHCLNSSLAPAHLKTKHIECRGQIHLQTCSLVVQRNCLPLLNLLCCNAIILPPVDMVNPWVYD